MKIKIALLLVITALWFVGCDETKDNNIISSRAYIEIWSPFKEGRCQDKDFQDRLRSEYDFSNLITQEVQGRDVKCEDYDKVPSVTCQYTSIEATSTTYGTATCVIAYDDSNLLSRVSLDLIE